MKRPTRVWGVWDRVRCTWAIGNYWYFCKADATRECQRLNPYYLVDRMKHGKRFCPKKYGDVVRRVER